MPALLLPLQRLQITRGAQAAQSRVTFVLRAPILFLLTPSLHCPHVPPALQESFALLAQLFHQSPVLLVSPVLVMVSVQNCAAQALQTTYLDPLSALDALLESGHQLLAPLRVPHVQLEPTQVQLAQRHAHLVLLASTLPDPQQVRYPFLLVQSALLAMLVSFQIQALLTHLDARSVLQVHQLLLAHRHAVPALEALTVLFLVRLHAVCVILENTLSGMLKDVQVVQQGYLFL